MNANESVPLMLTLPRKHRDLLRTMAAKKNLDDPARVTSASAIAAQIVISYLETEREERV
ncbi:MAG: hypothetical protein ABSC55_25390 [Syntrophorhabdales bacterium]|jgi:hypothetical protein